MKNKLVFIISCLCSFLSFSQNLIDGDVDAGNDRIQKYDNDGAFISSWEVYASGYTYLQYLDGLIYLLEFPLTAYDLDGEVVKKWESDKLHGQEQPLIVGNLIYEADPYNQTINVFEIPAD